MAVHIRLARHGTKKRAFYRVVVADGRSPRDGRFIENLGTFDPAVDKDSLRLNRERLDYWRSQGAQTSHTLARLLKQQASTPA
jgi:small subunit ribosomal protein S16